MSRTLLTLLGLLAAAVIFLTVNILATSSLRGPRLDLTEGKLYTLSPGSAKIAASVDEPVRLTLYYSEAVATDLPMFKSYATRLQEVLRELARASGGKVVVETVDPEPFSDAQDAATAAGLMGQPTGRAPFYFGLVGKNSTDRTETVPFFLPQREQFLEYELTRIVHVLSGPPKKTIGLMAQLPVEGMRDYPLAQGQDIPAWQFVRGLRDFFEVKTIDPAKAEIPADVTVLVLVHPKTLTDKVLYEIDQFVMRGGRLLAFVDPHCESDVPPGINRMQAMQLPKGSQLNKLLNAWGVEMVADRFAADKEAAYSMPVDQSASGLVPHVHFLQLRKRNLAESDAVTGQLEGINMVVAGVLRPRQGATSTFTPLIQTGTDAMMGNLNEVKMVADPKKLLAEFKAEGQPLTMAARISGTLASAFPAGDPTHQPQPGQEGKANEGHLAQSKTPAEVVIVADCDMLVDGLWVQAQRVGNIILGYNKVADNGDFVVSMVDNLSGSQDLIGLRARGKAARPFDRIQQIQKEADQKFLATEQELTKKLAAAQQELSQLVQQNPGGGTIMLTPEMQARLETTRAEMVRVRKELRDINYQRNKDIERIGTTLKFINIGLMPLAVGLAAVGLSAYRANRKRAWKGFGPRS
ncbi:MAG: GldG family protein [Phycisphaerales bacterium]